MTRRHLWLILLGLITVPAVLFTLYVGAALKWSYSDGERAGVLQKFSRRGWICKTYEGELAMSVVPGVAPTIWSFTVRDESVVPQLSAALGRRAVLHYTEHPGLPTTCFGHTAYFVDSVAVTP
jgi:hypothetical protein